MKRFSVSFVIASVYLAIGLSAYSQVPTVGLLYSTKDVTDGYTLFTPEYNTSVYLINNCGEKINEWNFSERPALTCYLLPNGNLLRAGQDSLEIRDWNNNLIWSYAMTINGLKQHHDIEPLPNGNILCVLGDLYSKSAIVAQGRDPLKTDPTFKLDKIVELKPAGKNNASVIWEWKFLDHIIQDIDSTKPNFGVIANHPELIDINFNNNNNFDYTHLNAVDYNAALDQIIISIRNLNELYIIDHSTTTIEAGGHSGGNSNHGGDILWRWGNPQVYGQGDATDQKLFLQHDPLWVEANYTDAGKISVFNNGTVNTTNHSSVHLINPVISNGVYTKINNKFAPLDFDWSWDGSILGNLVFQKTQSGAQSLPNGNFFICETTLGQISEITKNGNLVWTYKNPSGFSLYNQFDSIADDNSLFRAEKYPMDYPGFSGKDLTPKGIIENQNSNSDSCINNNNNSGITDINSEIISIVNPVENGKIQFNKSISLNSITIIDMTGKLVYTHGKFNGNSLEINLKPAIYILQLHSDKKIVTRKIIMNNLH